jgi:neutral ceramidase
MTRRYPNSLIKMAAAVVCLAAPASAGAAGLQAGVGRADITPPTGYFMMGWVRGDGIVKGQHTRLYARAIVLKQGAQKIALVAEDLNGIPGGVLAAAADSLKAYGFSQSNVLDSASHTHAAPSQFYNFGSYDTVFMSAGTPTQQNVSGTIDPQLYAFEVRQLAAAIRKADNDLGPAKVAWGHTDLLGVTQNRSLEAHLANFGIFEAFGTGNVSQDPGGYVDTIDPNVDVLRVDKLISTPVAPAPAACKKTRSKGPRRKLRCHNRPGAHRFYRAVDAAKRRRRAPAHKKKTKMVMRYAPVAMWSNFADHGTVNKFTFGYYNGDHHATADRVTEAAMRSAGNVPAGQDVVNAYGNSDEGDMTAGIAHTGPADAEWVGLQEANAMLSAWREAGQHLSSSVALDERWTRTCFCGQSTDGGNVAAKAVFGLPQLTGSEEGRGPLYDLTHVPFEGDTSPVNDPVQGDKIQEAQPPALSVPQAAPMMAVRIGDGLIVSVPGEMTVEMGKRVRAAVLNAVGGSGITHAVISGLANEYLSYFTTPEEYQRQHYEGGSTLYGEFSSNLIKQTLTDLAHRLASGQPAPDPYAYDPANGVSADAAPFSQGASSATATAQPTATPRLGHAVFTWNGGPRGEDRPVNNAFVTIRRLVAGHWQTVTDDLGLQVLWAVDNQGGYRGEWEVPLDATPGSYEFVITGNLYRLESAPFTVGPATRLEVARAGSSGATLTLGYPAAVNEVDITYRPATADQGTMTVQVNGATMTVHSSGGQFVVPAPAGATVTVAPGGAHDAFGNVNGNTLSFTA